MHLCGAGCGMERPREPGPRAQSPWHTHGRCQATRAGIPAWVFLTWAAKENEYLLWEGGSHQASMRPVLQACLCEPGGTGLKCEMKIHT